MIPILTVRVDNIAGICNRQRNVLGMMPHPERAVEKILGSDDGKLIFESILNELVAALEVTRRIMPHDTQNMNLHSKGLVKRYRKREVVSDVSINVKQGEIVGIAGAQRGPVRPPPFICS
ncbi:MAG: hypothetical protein U5K69_15005 [Balneolaceae bacterium]|nr:hypothetical protein [Balneolaceae bacterium]